MSARHARRVLATALTLATGATLGASLGPAVGTAAPPAADPPGTVTLLTGDRVTVDAAHNSYTFRPAAGREKVGYQLERSGTDTMVVPDDAARAVAAGTVDPKLFDVTLLAARGWTDGLPLAVTGTAAPATATVPAMVPAARLGQRWTGLTRPAVAGERLGTREPAPGVSAIRLAGEAPTTPRAAAAGDVTVTIKFTDRDGKATKDGDGALFGVDNSVTVRLAPNADGTATAQVPKGTYVLSSFVRTPRPGHPTPSNSTMVNVSLAVGGDTTLAADARTAKPIALGVPDPKAALVTHGEDVIRATKASSVLTGAGGHEPGDLFTRYDGPALPASQLTAGVMAQFARPGPAGAPDASPEVYGIGWQRQGSAWSGLTRTVTKAELSTVHAEHDAIGPNRPGGKSMDAVLPGIGVGYGYAYPSTPFDRTEHHAGNLPWSGTFSDSDAGHKNSAGQYGVPTTYRAGHTYTERWNAGPFLPRPVVFHRNGMIAGFPSLFNDRDTGHEGGDSELNRATVSLYRDGTLVGSVPQADKFGFTVPAGAATYRLTADVRRDFTGLSGSTSAAWTFHADGSDVAQYPLPSVFYRPGLDRTNHARAGSTVTMPVDVVRRVAGDPPVHDLTVQVSYDGKTWQAVPLTGSGAHRTAVLHLPKTAGAVSLRAHATDAAGNAVDQTVIGAFLTS